MRFSLKAVFTRRFSALALAFLAASGCSSGESVGPGPAPAAGVVTLQAVLPVFVRGLVLRVTGSGIDSTLVFNFEPDSAGVARGTLSVPIGPNRRFAAEAVDSLGSVTHRGETNTGISAGANPPLALTLNPLIGTVPVTITVGPLSLNITEGPTAVVLGDSAIFRATAVGPDGIVVPASEITFASSNPAVLRVASNGRGLAVLVGTVDVVATWRGLASTRRVAIAATAPLTGEILVATENPIGSTQTASLITPQGVGRVLFGELNMASLTVSPDLQTVIFQRAFENQILQRAAPFTTTTTLRADGVNFQMQLSRDGTRLVWFRQASLGGDAPSREIFIANADGSNGVALTSDNVADESPDLSPDNSTVIWSRQTSSGAKIFRMTSTGASPVQLTPSSSDVEYAARYSPDGTRIAMLVTRSGIVDLVVMLADGSQRTVVPVPASVAVGASVEWAPNGRVLAFGGTPVGGVRGVYLVNLDGSDLRRLRPNTTPELVLDWR